MTPSFRNLLLIAISVAFLHCSVSTAQTPPPGVYVEVEIEYDTGKVTDVHLNKSTGDPMLDAATIEKFRKWRFKPKKVRRVKIPILLPPHSIKDQKANRRSHLPAYI